MTKIEKNHGEAISCHPTVTVKGITSSDMGSKPSAICLRTLCWSNSGLDRLFMVNYSMLRSNSSGPRFRPCLHKFYLINQ